MRSLVLGTTVVVGLLAVAAFAARPVPATSLSAFTPGHLYAAQGSDIASKVYRYPLGPNGLPSKVPDGELSLDFQYPGGIAVGPDGDLYVSSAGNGNACDHECFVAVFAPGASGRAKPIRVLDIPQGPVLIACRSTRLSRCPQLQDRKLTYGRLRARREWVR